MNIFKKQFLFALLLVCSSHYQVHGTAKTVKESIENEIKELRKKEQELAESLQKTKDKIEDSIKKAATEAKKAATETKNQIGRKLNSL